MAKSRYAKNSRSDVILLKGKVIKNLISKAKEKKKTICHGKPIYLLNALLQATVQRLTLDMRLLEHRAKICSETTDCAKNNSYNYSDGNISLNSPLGNNTCRTRQLDDLKSTVVMSETSDPLGIDAFFDDLKTVCMVR